MKKLIAVCGMLATLLTSAASAGREEFGVYGDWNTYRLTFPNGTDTDRNLRWTCATRGFYTSNQGEVIKVIFAIYNTGLAKFYVENDRNVFPARYARSVPVHVYDQNGQAIFSAMGRYENNTSSPTNQIGFEFNVEFLKAIYFGYTLSTAMPDGRPMKFDISRQGLNSAIEANIDRCLPQSVGTMSSH